MHDEFALIVSKSHPWWKRRVIPFSELHQQRLLQLSDTFVMRRMTDQICLKHQVRPRTVAELNAIETLLRSLGPLQAAAIMPKIALRGREALELEGDSASREESRPRYWPAPPGRFRIEQRRQRLCHAGEDGSPEADRQVTPIPALL